MATYKDVLMLVDKVSEPLKKISKNTDKFREKTAKLRSGIKKASAVIGALGSAVGLVGGALVRGANQVAEIGDRIDKMSQKIGMSRKAFQEWDYIMSQNGGNVESLQMGFKTLVTQIEGVQKGSKDSTKAFKDLGVRVKDNNGNFRSADDIFNDTIRSLQKMENPTQKMILANRLFGRSAAELRPLLNQEAQAVDDLRKKANAMGLIISDKDIDNSVKFKDTMDTFTRFFQAKFATSMMQLMPELSKALEDIIAYTQKNQEVFDNIGATISFITTKALPFVIKSVITIGDILQNIGYFVGELVGKILSIPTVIYMAFNTLKTNITIILMTIWQFIQKIISGIQLVVGKIPAVGKFLTGGASTNNRTTNNTSNVTNITNNYNNGNYGNLTPLSSGIYAVAR